MRMGTIREVENIRQEVVVSYFKALSQHSHGDTQVYHDISQHSRWPDRDSKGELPECKSEALRFEPAC